MNSFILRLSLLLLILYRVPLKTLSRVIRVMQFDVCYCDAVCYICCNAWVTQSNGSLLAGTGSRRWLSTWSVSPCPPTCTALSGVRPFSHPALSRGRRPWPSRPLPEHPMAYLWPRLSLHIYNVSKDATMY